MYKTASLTDTINGIPLNDTDHGTSTFLPTLHMMGGLKVKRRKGYVSPSPCRQIRMLRATIRYQDDIICRSTRFKSSLLHFNKLDINNNHLLTNLEYNNHLVVNFSLQFTPNQVDSNTDLLD